MIDPLAEMGEAEENSPPLRQDAPGSDPERVPAFGTRHVQALSLTWRMCLGGDLIAEIYRHSSEFLSVPEFQPQVQVVLDALSQAGEEVVRQGQVNAATMADLSQDLAPADTLARLGREFWSQGANG